MTALQLNAELFRELSIIAEDEGLMKKALKALKKIICQEAGNGRDRVYHVFARNGENHTPRRERH